EHDRGRAELARVPGEDATTGARGARGAAAGFVLHDAAAPDGDVADGVEPATVAVADVARHLAVDHGQIGLGEHAAAPVRVGGCDRRVAADGRADDDRSALGHDAGAAAADVPGHGDVDEGEEPVAVLPDPGPDERDGVAAGQREALDVCLGVAEDPHHAGAG